MHEPLFQALDEGAVVLTANARLTRHLRGAYHRRQRARGLETWETPRLMPLGAWLGERWEEAAERAAEAGGEEPPAPLGDHLAAALWERIILESPQGPRLLQPERAAELAQHAWRLANAWRVPPEGPAPTEEARAFREWTAAFETRCREARLLDDARLPDWLTERIRAGGLSLPPRVLYAGFDDVTPQQAALFEALRAARCPAEPWNPEPLAGEAVRTAFPDPAAELEAAARWARALLESEPADPAFAAPIAIVVPDPDARRAEIERVLRDRLDPGEPLHEPGARLPFNLSAPLSLADEPVVRAALDLLAPRHGAVDFAAISRILRSPFLGGAERERDARARLDARLRGLGAAELSWETVLRFARGRDGGEAPCPLLARALQRAAQREREGAGSRPPSAWAEAFLEALRHAHGWPNAHLPDGGDGVGDRPLSSAEYQAVETFRETLGELAALDAALPRLSRAEAVSWLRWLCERTDHLPRREPAPVQVLGVLEAGGLRFGHLWLMGFHDGEWPRGPAPNPFLPLAAQRARNVPRSSAQREFADARAQTARLLGSAPHVIASHAERDGERELAISPLLRPLRAVAPDALPRSAAPTHRETMAPGPEGPALQPLSDFRVAALPEGSAVSGGTRVFQDQAACPFRAFAAHRLHAEDLAEPEPGLPAWLRGTLAHGAMERAWAELVSHEVLCARDETALRRLADGAAEGAVAAYAERSPHWREHPLMALERRRLGDLVYEVLQIEKARAPFRVVKREEKLPARFGGLEIETRLDRMDALEAGGHVVIDYKSGEVWPASWIGERPDEPQLPLYCAAAEEAVAGVAFVRLSRKALNDRKGDGAPRVFVGLAQAEESFPKADFPGMSALADPKRRGLAATIADLPSLVAGWRGVLEGLGRAFREGDARVDPKADGARSPCRSCAFPALCRVDELLGATDEPGEPEGGEPGGEGGDG